MPSSADGHDVVDLGTLSSPSIAMVVVLSLTGGDDVVVSVTLSSFSTSTCSTISLPIFSLSTGGSSGPNAFGGNDGTDDPPLLPPSHRSYEPLRYDGPHETSFTIKLSYPQGEHSIHLLLFMGLAVERTEVLKILTVIMTESG